MIHHNAFPASSLLRHAAHRGKASPVRFPALVAIPHTRPLFDRFFQVPRPAIGEHPLPYNTVSVPSLSETFQSLRSTYPCARNNFLAPHEDENLRERDVS